MADNTPSTLQVRARDEDLKGQYANTLMVTAQERDIVVDFLSTVKIGSNTQNTLVSRIFLNHHVAGQLIDLLANVRKQWEEKRYG